MWVINSISWYVLVGLFYCLLFIDAKALMKDFKKENSQDFIALEESPLGWILPLLPWLICAILWPRFFFTKLKKSVGRLFD